MRAVQFSSSAFKDYVEWATQNKDVFQRINSLVKEILREPFKGTGKPEPLKGNLKGCWSRRITDEHRLVYQVSSDVIFIISCHGHYN